MVPELSLQKTENFYCGCLAPPSMSCIKICNPLLAQNLTICPSYQQSWWQIWAAELSVSDKLNNTRVTAVLMMTCSSVCNYNRMLLCFSRYTVACSCLY